jgi:O-antigen ligase
MQRDYHIECLAAAAAVCAAPVSIAVSETFLAIALISRAAARPRRLAVPRVFWVWLLWAGLEILSWWHSPRPRAGTGEIRHLLLIAALFAVLPALHRPDWPRRVWQGVFLTSTAGSISVIWGFFTRLIQYHHELSAGGDPGFYLRNGGLLHHWMIYATVEAMVFGPLLEYRALWPESRRVTTAALAIHGVAILLSLTRCLWLACSLVLAIHLFRRRSRWVWMLPALPVLALTISPVRHRIVESFQPDYYSNAERLQMVRVGWSMIRAHPLLGVGPGRVEELYPRYLRAGEPLPAYHGHLHTNAVQIAAEFGLPAFGAALLCLGVLLADLSRANRQAAGRTSRFLCRGAVLALIGFLSVGLLDYTYGHSLGIILVIFAALMPLSPHGPRTELISVYEATNVQGITS